MLWGTEKSIEGGRERSRQDKEGSLKETWLYRNTFASLGLDKFADAVLLICLTYEEFQFSEYILYNQLTIISYIYTKCLV